MRRNVRPTKTWRLHDPNLDAQLNRLSAENEVVEFKEVKSGYAFTKLGQYFSA